MRATFSSLAERDFRLYFAGHSVSSIGVWMQRIGQAWLVLEITDSGAVLGLVSAVEYMPIMVASPWGGLLADRTDKRKLLIRTELAAAFLALAFGVLTDTGLIRLWMILLLAFGLGVTQSLSLPTKKSLVYEIVGPHLVTNAIALHSVVFNIARTVGPAVAGYIIVTVGLAPSFYGNAVSYVVFVLMLVAIRTSDLIQAAPAERTKGQLTQGWHYVRRSPHLAAPLVLMAISGTLAYEWAVTVPLLAVDAFGGDAQTFGLMFSSMGVGAVIGGLAVAGSLKPSMSALFRIAWLFSAALIGIALAPTLELALAVFFLLGASSIAFRAVATSIVQIRSSAEMRGRVMALLVIALTGTTPVGGPLVGWISEVVGIRFAFALGAVATAGAALGARLYLRARAYTEVDGSVSIGQGRRAEN